MSDWSSDVCSSDLAQQVERLDAVAGQEDAVAAALQVGAQRIADGGLVVDQQDRGRRRGR